MKKINIYTDGASKGNPGKGGYGVIMMLENTNYKKEFFEGFRLTTNNRMELLSVIEALKKVKDSSFYIDLYTDSKYVSDAINKGWLQNWIKKGYKDVKNPDLWQQLSNLLPKFNINFIWIKGHNGNIFNEQADKLAVKGSMMPDLKIDYYYENNYK